MAEFWSDIRAICTSLVADTPSHIIVATFITALLGLLLLAYLLLFLVAPVPRKPFPEEKEYRTVSKDGLISGPHRLPCWQDTLDSQKKRHAGRIAMEPSELFMSVVVPAYNEEERIGGMLEEAVGYLEHVYGTLAMKERKEEKKEGVVFQTTERTTVRRRQGDDDRDFPDLKRDTLHDGSDRGWEIIIVSDGSQDKTEEVVFSFARDHQLSLHPKGYVGPWTVESHEGVHIPPGTIRVVTLCKNRGKGGAVTHGMRHVRGQYVVFADADGATRFNDLGKLVSACSDVADSEGRVVAVGSRAHMVGSEAVVNRSKLRNFLMHSFHLILWILTPRNTATIKDTQCGFKLFSRSSLPYIIPYMHSEGWIFDVEMLMLAEFAGIPVVEVPVTWREVKGSKLNVLRDSIGMAWGLAILRASWSLGVYRRT